jgi:nicotinate phosphoribosyltransferase
MARFNLSDEYLNRAGDTVAGTPRGQTPVCYAISCRRGGMLCGVADIVDLLTDHCQGPLTLRGKSDGEHFEPGEIVLTLEGPFEELVTLETLGLGILSLSAGAGNMADLVEAAGDAIQIIDTSSRRYPPELIAPLAVAAAVGGARGTSTPAGKTAAIERFGVGGDQIRVGQRDPVTFGVFGSVPPALASVFADHAIDGAAAFHTACPDALLSLSLGADRRERDTAVQAALRFGSGLDAVRLDTPKEQIHQGGHENPMRTLEMRILSQAPDRPAAQQALDSYGFGPGVTIEAIYAIRDLLDAQGARSARIVVTGEFDAQYVRALRACSTPVDTIETHGWVEFAEFTARIARVFEDGKWVTRTQAGPETTMSDSAPSESAPPESTPPDELESLPIIFQK